MLFIFKGGKSLPNEKGYDSNFYLLSFEKDARNNRGYLKILRDGSVKLYFKWDWKIEDERVNKGKNYKIFSQLDSAINFLLEIKMSDRIAIAQWNGASAEIVKSFSNSVGANEN